MNIRLESTTTKFCTSSSSDLNCPKMSPTKKKGVDAKSTDVESKINEIITDGLALSNTDGKMEVDYSETTNEKVRIQFQDLTADD